MLEGARMREPLDAGFPARFHVRVELWSAGGLFNQLERHLEYDLLVHFIALEKVYEVLLVENDRPFSLGKFASIEDAEQALARPRRVPVTAPSNRRQMYYQVTLEAENLSVSDLDDLNRWLRGELQPAIRGQRNPGTALTRGLRSLTARLLGGGTREYVATSQRFRVR